MSRRLPISVAVRRVALGTCVAAVTGTALWSEVAGAAGNYPITPDQRSTAQQVAQAGVPLSELAPNAPDTHTVVRGDTLWGISGIFLKRPWRWPELWGMNLDQIRNPHLIYPGQVLVLDKSGGRARLRLAGGDGEVPTVRLSPQVRATDPGNGAIASIPFNLIEPFLNEAVIFQTNELEQAPRIVAAQEGRVYMGRGDTAYVRGELGSARDFRIFREPRPLRDPDTNAVLGYEANYVGAAEYVRPGEVRTDATGHEEIVPATFKINSVRQEAGVGDRLLAVPPREFTNYGPHAPAAPIAGRIVSIYGDAITAGQNQIVALNKGAADGLERGHVLALWRDGNVVTDTTDPHRTSIKLPDERHGLLFVFRVFDRMSYALILSVQEPVKPGDRFTQP